MDSLFDMLISHKDWDRHTVVLNSNVQKLPQFGIINSL